MISSQSDYLSGPLRIIFAPAAANRAFLKPLFQTLHSFPVKSGKLCTKLRVFRKKTIAIRTGKYL